jgi:hypothetical protein
MLLPACGRQALITGEPEIYAVDPLTGVLRERDEFPSPSLQLPAATTNSPAIDTTPANLAPNTADAPPAPVIIPVKNTDIVTISIGSVFIKYLRSIGSPHVLVYAEIYDDGTDDSSTAKTKVLFNERNQPPGVGLGLADRILYGPAVFKGYPIRIRFYVIQLNKETKARASQIINAVGSIATAGQPQYSPAINVAVQIAQSLNELTEDDFELRFDLTLTPQGTIGRARIDDSILGRGGEAPQHLPTRRERQPIALTTPLHTGAFIIIKRELRERTGIVGEALNATVQADLAQDATSQDYVSSEGNAVRAESVFRVQGGRLFRIYRTLWEWSNSTKSAGIKGWIDRSSEGIVVVPETGVNAGARVTLSRGFRQLYRDRTYVTFTIATGLGVALSEDQLKISSERDRRLVSSLMDDPIQSSIAGRVDERVNELGDAVKGAIHLQRSVQRIARRVAMDPNLRASVEYPKQWIDQLAVQPTNDKNQNALASDAAAKNASLLDAMYDLIVNLPTLSPDSKSQMMALKSLPTTDFEPLPFRAGSFRLTKAGLDKLTAVLAAGN